MFVSQQSEPAILKYFAFCLIEQANIIMSKGNFSMFEEVQKHRVMMSQMNIVVLK